jgi:hypothetical protein
VTLNVPFWDGQPFSAKRLGGKPMMPWGQGCAHNREQHRAFYGTGIPACIVVLDKEHAAGVRTADPCGGRTCQTARRFGRRLEQQFTYSHELSHRTLCGESDRYRQVIVQTATQLLMSFAEEVAEQQAAALKSILIILYALAYRIGTGICSIFLLAAAAKNIIRTLMAHKNSREPAYLPISRLPLYQSPAGVALVH